MAASIDSHGLPDHNKEEHASDPNLIKLEAHVSASTFETLQRICKEEKQDLSTVIDGMVSRLGHNTCAQLPTQASFKPRIDLREAPLDLERAALLYIDVQNFNCHKRGACHSKPEDPSLKYWWERLQQTEPVWQLLQQTCRKAGVEVLYTVIESLTYDGRDRSLDYKISGYHVPPSSFDGKVLDCIQPQADEIVIRKTSSSVFTTTNIDRLLRNLDIKSLILVGCLTDQCVESAVRDACDLNYLVTVVSDGCATYTQERHDNSLRTIKGYCRQRTSDELIQEIHMLSKLP